EGPRRDEVGGEPVDLLTAQRAEAEMLHAPHPLDRRARSASGSRCRFRQVSTAPFGHVGLYHDCHVTCPDCSSLRYLSIMFMPMWRLFSSVRSAEGDTW